MRTVEVRRPGELVVTERVAAVPGPDELLIEPLLVGVCATDQELLDGSLVYVRDGRTSLPLVPGHEWVGRIAAKGESVRSFAVGDVVVGECSIGCGRCPKCWDGLYHQCPARRETGIMGLDGALSQQMVFPARSAHRVPAGVSLEDATLTEPLAVALRGVDRLDVQAKESVLVIGAGVIGLLAIMLLKTLHEGDLYVLEPNECRRVRATQLGAKPVPEGFNGFDKILEASGAVAGIQSALDLLASAGRLVIVGLNGLPGVPVNTDAVVVSDQTIVGSLGSPGVWDRALAFLANGDVQPRKLITHFFPIERSEEAFECATSRDQDVLKVVIYPNGAIHE